MKLEELISELLVCRRCGLCRDPIDVEHGVDCACPVWRNSAGFETDFARGKIQVALALLQGNLDVSPEMSKSLYRCTLCDNCSAICPAGLEIAKLLEKVREFVSSKVYVSEKHAAIVESIEKYGNPYLTSPEKRFEWLGEDLSKMPDEAETVYFVGCTTSLRTPEIAKATIKILESTNTDFTVLKNEWCCGSILLRVGFLNEAIKAAEKVVKAIENTGAKTVITSCAGCFRALKYDYPELLGDIGFEVLHTVQFIDKLLKEGKLGLNKLSERIKVTYHDPCHLGRHGLVYEEPRDVLRQISNLELVETIPNRQFSMCCGAGGGLKLLEGELAVKIASEKIKKVSGMNVHALVSACPFCKYNFIEAVSREKTNLKVYDIVELIVKAIG